MLRSSRKRTYGSLIPNDILRRKNITVTAFKDLYELWIINYVQRKIYLDFGKINIYVRRILEIWKYIIRA
jgi:hypothetical protein